MKTRGPKPPLKSERVQCLQVAGMALEAVDTPCSVFLLTAFGFIPSAVRLVVTEFAVLLAAFGFSAEFSSGHDE